MRKKFMVGDRVAATCDNPAGSRIIQKNDFGTVCQAYEDMIGVQWDRYVGGHDCSGHCEYGYGWRVYRDEIALIEEDADFDINDDAFMSII